MKKRSVKLQSGIHRHIYSTHWGLSLILTHVHRVKTLYHGSPQKNILHNLTTIYHRHGTGVFGLIHPMEDQYRNDVPAYLFTTTVSPYCLREPQQAGFRSMHAGQRQSVSLTRKSVSYSQIQCAKAAIPEAVLYCWLMVKNVRKH